MTDHFRFENEAVKMQLLPSHLDSRIHALASLNPCLHTYGM